jgi:glycosyltransferase involved in cell wall biosynthesis
MALRDRELTSRRAPRLLFVVTEDWYFASHRLPLAHAAVEAGFEVLVACRVRDHGEVLRRAGCEVIPFEMSRSGTNPFREWRTYRRLIALYRALRPTIVHHVALKPVLYGSFAARRAGVPGVVNAIAGLGYLSTSNGTKARILRPLVVAALRGAMKHHNTSLIVQNRDDERMLLERGIASSAQLICLPGVGVDLRRFSPVPEPDGPPLVLLPARMLWAKGVGTFVDAATRLIAEGVEARFVLAGRTDPENPTAIAESQLGEWTAAGTVEWWGNREDMDQVLRAAAVVCLPSAYGEGIPKSLLEGAASGRPIVTTDTPGCREVVGHGENGLLVPANDAIALAGALKTLIGDRELRARLGARGRARAEAEFGEDAVTRATLGVYSRLLSPMSQASGFPPP